MKHAPFIGIVALFLLLGFGLGRTYTRSEDVAQMRAMLDDAQAKAKVANAEYAATVASANASDAATRRKADEAIEAFKAAQWVCEARR